MEYKNDYKEERFNSFLNKTIILSSKAYFKKQAKINNTEKVIIDDENFSSYIQGYIASDKTHMPIENIESSMELNHALNCLSNVEQAVIFLLYKQELTQTEASAILKICSNSVSRIKLRAVDKLKKYLKGDLKDEK